LFFFFTCDDTCVVLLSVSLLPFLALHSVFLLPFLSFIRGYLQNYPLCFLLVVSENKMVLPNGAERQIARGWKGLFFGFLRLFLEGLDFVFFQEMDHQYIF